MTCFWRALSKTVCTEPDTTSGGGGDFMGAGLNDFGQLGLGHTNPVHAFTPIPLSGVVKVAMGLKFSMALTGDGDLYACGINDLNQITDAIPAGGTHTYTLVRQNVTQVICGSTFTLIRSNQGNGDIFEMTGKASPPPYDLYFSPPYSTYDFSNFSPAFGASSVQSDETPIMVGTASDVAVIYERGSFPNYSGTPQAVHKDKQQFTSGYQAGATGSAADDGAAFASIRNNPLGYSTAKVLELRASFGNYTQEPPYQIYNIISGSYHFAAAAEFSIPPQSDDIFNIFAGAEAVFYTTFAGELWGRGKNIKGELGTGDTVQVLDTSGANSYKSVATDVVDVVSVAYATFIKKTDGKWYVTGRNLYGSAGLGHTNDTLSFVEVGQFSELSAHTYDTLVVV